RPRSRVHRDRRAVAGTGGDRARARRRPGGSGWQRGGGGPTRSAVPRAVSLASVIVPTAVGGPRIRELLQSLRGRPAGVEVLVVDNNSADPEIGGLGDRFEGVRVIRLGANAGYSRAVNLAAREAAGDAIVLLNDDCVCDPGYIRAIVA